MHWQEWLWIALLVLAGVCLVVMAWTVPRIFPPGGWQHYFHWKANDGNLCDCASCATYRKERFK